MNSLVNINYSPFIIFMILVVILIKLSNKLNSIIKVSMPIQLGLEQLFLHQKLYQFKVLLMNNQNTFKIIDFLGKTIKKVYLHPQQSPLAYNNRQQAICNVCHHNIEHTNIKQLQRQILDRSPYPFQQLEQDMRYSDTHLQYDERFATPEEVLMKKMGSLQKNIN